MTAAYRVKLRELQNCYGYAIHVYSESKAYECEFGVLPDGTAGYNYIERPYRQQPGEFAHTIDYVSNRLEEAKSKTNAKDYMDIIQSFIYEDFAALRISSGEEWIIRRSTETEAVPAGCRKIALVIKLGGDFHFYLRHSDGIWSHKPGAGHVTNKSLANSNLILTDSNIDTEARRNVYPDGIRYYIIGKSAIIDYCHKAGHYGSVNKPRPSPTPLQTTPAFTDRAGTVPKTSQTISGTLTGARFDYSGDIDYYAFTPSQSGTYTIKTSITSSTYDVDIVVSNFRNVPVASATGPENAVLTVNLVAGNTYYIKVSDSKNNKGTYTLYIS